MKKKDSFAITGRFVLACLAFGLISDDQEDTIWRMAMNDLVESITSIP